MNRKWLQLFYETHTHKWMRDDVVCRFHRWIITLMTYRVSLGRPRCVNIHQCFYSLAYEFILSDNVTKRWLFYLEFQQDSRIEVFHFELKLHQHQPSLDYEGFVFIRLFVELRKKPHPKNKINENMKSNCSPTREPFGCRKITQMRVDSCNEKPFSFMYRDLEFLDIAINIWMLVFHIEICNHMQLSKFNWIWKCFDQRTWQCLRIWFLIFSITFHDAYQWQNQK